MIQRQNHFTQERVIEFKARPIRFAPLGHKTAHQLINGRINKESIMSQHRLIDASGMRNRKRETDPRTNGPTDTPSNTDRDARMHQYSTNKRRELK